ncbi:glycosyltransferase family 2 protein [Candidatus Dojkabacteria bacterium]|nr:glycosyltransferase family 2 protein [Candidatus Dojkabacteria bacterium]
MYNKKKVKISCVIPAYNEEIYINRVLENVIGYQNFNEIIIVNDGSTDNTSAIIERIAKKSSKISLLTHQKNLGKTQSIMDGVNMAKGKLIVIVDADLKNLNHTHLDKLIAPVVNSEVDMTILDRGSDQFSPIGWSSFIIARTIGGERAFWKSDFEQLALKGNERYGLEVIMNMAYIAMNKRIRTISVPDLESLYQFKKTGSFSKGLIRSIGIASDIIKVSGVKNFISQGVEIEEERLDKLYEIKRKSKRKTPILALILVSGLALSFGTFWALNVKRGIKKVGEGLKPS